MKTLKLTHQNPFFKGLSHKVLSFMIVFQFICNPLINIGFANDTELPVEQVTQTSESDQQVIPPTQIAQEAQVNTSPDASIIDTSTDTSKDE